MDAPALHAALAAVCPILGVSLGDPDNRATWRIDFDPAATTSQRRAATALLATFTGVDLATYIAAAHAALRDGGVTVGSMRIKTDAESRGLIDGAYALSQVRPDNTIDFKAATGWADVDSQTMQTVSIAVGLWVQACYSAYRQVDEGRMAGTITTTAQVDAAFAAVALPS
ncbi:hypothetical protein [Methylobacterium sp. 391_Methyba4]|uniref:DUF4376 domain-containing protein n=1 Tax=Methylobacterium sp. 391_Methyba4 TaxID=3038924 RepID=UPI00241D20E0|nr:hypothetical protein [Methylobacterium sp. 391_Methyba4]WFS07795.1 hypothetical protein P9K36_00360 [Methylobacterium sp. 391_Methyba4]